MDRRKFLEVGIRAVCGIVLAVGAYALGRFTVGHSFRKDLSRWVEVKPPAALSGSPEFMKVVLEYETKDGWMKTSVRRLVYVKREKGGQLTAISSECSHLGCIVTWDEKEKIFKCPCHDGKYDAEGRVISGPPPAPLQRHRAKIENGSIFLSTETVVFGGERTDAV